MLAAFMLLFVQEKLDLLLCYTGQLCHFWMSLYKLACSNVYVCCHTESYIHALAHGWKHIFSFMVIVIYYVWCGTITAKNSNWIWRVSAKGILPCDIYFIAWYCLLKKLSMITEVCVLVVCKISVSAYQMKLKRRLY